MYLMALYMSFKLNYYISHNSKNLRKKNCKIRNKNVILFNLLEIKSGTYKRRTILIIPNFMMYIYNENL